MIIVATTSKVVFVEDKFQGTKSSKKVPSVWVVDDKDDDFFVC